MKYILIVMTMCMALLAGVATATAAETSVALSGMTLFSSPSGFEGLLAGLVGLAGVTLAANQLREFEIGDLNDLPVIAADVIYQGAVVGIVAASGHARPLVAGDAFAGFATDKADNSAGLAAAINVNVRQRGRVQLAVSGLVAANIGASIYASDDNTFTKTATANTLVGKCVRVVSSGIGIVEFDVSKI